MTSPDLIDELKASRPAAPTALRARVREIAASRTQAPRQSLLADARLPVRRIALVAVPAARARARERGRARAWRARRQSTTRFSDTGTPSRPDPLARRPRTATPPQDCLTRSSGAGQDCARRRSRRTPTRAQRVSATLTVEVADSDDVSRAAQKALDLTESLGGHVVSANVATGDEGSAALIVRVPVDKVQEAIVQLSALGRIVSQQVTIDDLQATLDTLERRERSVRAQIALVSGTARDRDARRRRPALSSRPACGRCAASSGSSGATSPRRTPRRGWRRSSSRSSRRASSAPSPCRRGSTGRWTRRSTSSSGKA